jgi:Domain of unknown function (DUF4281)
MNWETVFSLVNGWALLAWLLLAFAPRKPLVLSAVMYLGVALLCLVYTVLIVGLLSGGIDGGPGGSGGSPDFTTLAGVMALFDTPGGATLGWTHYLAFDLFTGLWIARDADAKGFGRIVQFPFLFLTFMVGPVGLLLWLIVRERRARAVAKA